VRWPASVPIQGGGRVHSSFGVCHRGVSQLVGSSQGPGFVAGAENASISLSGAPGALARHGSQIHEGMTNGPFGSDPRLDRGVAGWPTGVTGHEAHHRRHDQQGYFCQAKQCMSGDGVFTIACRLQSGGLLGHQATTTKPVNGPPGTSRTSGRPPSGMRCQTGLSLVCDCPLDQICEADILIGLYFDATSPVSDPRHRGTDGK
jgi:hypothetical protein